MFVPFTGLYHVGAREYDPRTARWLQRDPIGVAGGDINLYRYCFNRPLQWKDPSGLDVVVFVHGTFGNESSFDKDFISAVKRTFSATAHVMFVWHPATWRPSDIIDAGCELSNQIAVIRRKHPGERVFVVGHSNGGNVAVAAAQNGAIIDGIVRLGSPYFVKPNLINTGSDVIVLDFFDRRDSVQFGGANEFGGALPLNRIPKDWSSDPNWKGWRRFEVFTGWDCRTGKDVHAAMRSSRMWIEDGIGAEVARWFR